MKHTLPFLALLGAAFLAASCSSSWLPDVGHLGGDVLPASRPAPVSTGTGLVVGDEPLAVQAGADMLAQGGSAADAAAATYFALAVTYPVAAGLGGGGICLVRDPTRDTVESINFLPHNVRGGGAFAVPGNVRGFALLQSLYGKKPWQSVVVGGERLATLGFPMSHALFERVIDSANLVRLDAGLAKVFMDESGNMHHEGDTLRDPALGSSLAAIRTEGPNALYGGQLADALGAYAAQQSAPIAPDEFVNYAPQRTPVRVATAGGITVYLPSERTGAGKLAASVIANSTGDLAGAVNAALKGYGVGVVPNDLGATGFAAIDQDGQAVACAVTMTGPFGSGRTAGASGITFANAPSSTDVGVAVAFLTPVIAAEGSALALVGAGAGGADAIAGILADVMARAGHQSMPERDPAKAALRLSINAIVCDGAKCSVVPSRGTGAVGGD